MEVKNGLKFADIKRFIGEHLKTAMGINTFSISFAKHEENKWRVNVEWKEDISGTGILFTQTALFTLDDKTGEILEFQKGKWWNF